MNRLDPAVIFGPGASRRVIGRQGEVLRVVDSTMDLARHRAAAGAPDGYVVLAEKQRAGRGRSGSWECPPGQGLLMSVVLRLGLPRADRPRLALMGAVAAAEALRQFGAQARIKWPNDIVVTGGEGLPRLRKLGGVLVEQCSQGDSAPAHLLGIGLNVNQHSRRLPSRTPLPATSLRAELGGRATDRNELCLRLLEKLDSWYSPLRRGHPELLLARWRTLSCLLGEMVSARVGERIIRGRVTGLRSSGELVLSGLRGCQVVLKPGKDKLLLERSAPSV